MESIAISRGYWEQTNWLTLSWVLCKVPGRYPLGLIRRPPNLLPSPTSNHYYLIYILRYEIVLVVIRSTVRVIPRKLSELPMLSIGKASYHGAAVPCRMRQREMTSRSILAHGSARSHWHCRLASTSTFLLSAPKAAWPHAD